MKRLLAILLLSFTFYSSSYGQDSWSVLSMVTFDKKYNVEFGMETLSPKYSPILLGIDGKEIEVKGYFIALNGKAEQNHFMLSKFPQSTCFFCGKAGPETAMQVFLANNKKQK